MKRVLGTAAAIGTAVVIGIGAAGIAGFTRESAHPSDALAVRDGDGWTTWWRRDPAPARWNGDAPLAARVSWRPAANGLEWGELLLSGASEAWRTRLVLVRIDPRRVELSVAPAFKDDKRWTIGDAPADAILALDAGQFRGSLPWGWVVSGGKELLSSQYAPLAGAVVLDEANHLRIVSPDSVAGLRGRAGILEAFQSYPMLLDRGQVPAPLQESGRGVDLGHRDARLALGTLEDGRVVVALSRFDALGKTLGRVPFGLTSPEMAAVMGALGCREAILLDGGISGQLLLRDAAGVRQEWPGSRSVPLGLVGRMKP